MIRLKEEEIIANIGQYLLLLNSRKLTKKDRP